MKTHTITRRGLLGLEATKQEPMHATLSSDPVPYPEIGSSSPNPRKHLKPSSPFDTSMALTILVLFSALFFMGFFSLYIRRFATVEEPSDDRRRAESRRKGLDPASIGALPVVRYGAPAKQGIISGGCAICLSEFKEGEMVKLIPRCGHVFHPTCIDTWLSSHVSCPLCRSTQLFGDVRLGVDESERSTADVSDTCREMMTMRRPCSRSSLELESTRGIA